MGRYHRLAVPSRDFRLETGAGGKSVLAAATWPTSMTIHHARPPSLRLHAGITPAPGQTQPGRRSRQLWGQPLFPVNDLAFHGRFSDGTSGHPIWLAWDHNTVGSLLWRSAGGLRLELRDLLREWKFGRKREDNPSFHPAHRAYQEVN
jgi:hypothetical protein